MGIENSLISMAKEIILFNSFEAIFYIGMFMVAISKKIDIKQFVFHVVMISILDYCICNFITIPVLIQLGMILSLSFYFSIVFKINLLKSIFLNTKNFFMLFIIEIGLAILTQCLFHIELIGMSNDYLKFLYMIHFRIIEISFIYIYYKLKRGDFYHAKANKIHN